MLEVSAAPAGPLIRVRIDFSYHGGPYRGFAYQTAEVPTVARALRRALAPMVGYEPNLTVAGRTDAGVHAQAQVVHFDVEQSFTDRFDLERICKSLNKQLDWSIVIKDVSLPGPSFDARRSATARRYRYSVLNTHYPSPFNAATTWHVHQALDLDAMNEAAAAIVGEHDFSSFCKMPPGRIVDLTRRIHSAEWLDLGDIKRFDVEAKAFCHQMVRSLVGVMVLIGRGLRPPESMAEVLAAKHRQPAGSPAPPQGLCLWEVVY